MPDNYYSDYTPALFNLYVFKLRQNFLEPSIYYSSIKKVFISVQGGGLFSALARN